jgi:hypothetical protein
MLTDLDLNRAYVWARPYAHWSIDKQSCSIDTFRRFREGLKSYDMHDCWNNQSCALRHHMITGALLAIIFGVVFAAPLGFACFCTPVEAY